MPIFANKKKRHKQAIYANPSMDEFTFGEGWDGMASLLDHTEYSGESGNYVKEESSSGKENSDYPTFRNRYGGTSNNKVKDQNPIHQTAWPPSTPSHPSHSYGRNIATQRSGSGNNRRGKQNDFPANTRGALDYTSSNTGISKGPPAQSNNCNTPRSRYVATAHVLT